MPLWNLPYEDISFWPYVELSKGWMEDCDKTEPRHNSTFQGSPKLSFTAHPSIYYGCNSGTPRAAWCSHRSAVASYIWEGVLGPQHTLGELLLRGIWNWVQTLKMNQCEQLIRWALAPCIQTMRSFMDMAITAAILFLSVSSKLSRAEHKYILTKYTMAINSTELGKISVWIRRDCCYILTLFFFFNP